MFHFSSLTGSRTCDFDDLVEQFATVSAYPFALPPNRSRRVASFLLPSHASRPIGILWSGLELLHAAGYELRGVFYGSEPPSRLRELASRFDTWFGAGAFSNRLGLARIDRKAPLHSMIAVRGAFCWSGPAIGAKPSHPEASVATNELDSIELALATSRLYQTRSQAISVPIDADPALCG